jgi:hypothetical protein
LERLSISCQKNGNCFFDIAGESSDLHLKENDLCRGIIYIVEAGNPHPIQIKDLVLYTHWKYKSKRFFELLEFKI